VEVTGGSKRLRGDTVHVAWTGTGKIKEK